MIKNVSFSPVLTEQINPAQDPISTQDNVVQDNVDKDNVDKDTNSSPKKYSTHTKFCLYGLTKCKKGPKCIYAHTFKELNPIICKWGDECLRKHKCYYKHNNETKIHYVLRAFPDDIKRLGIVLFDEPKKIVEVEEKTDDTRQQVEIEEEFDEEAYKKAWQNFRSMYYDPVFEYYNWADINEMVDSDDE